MTEFAACYRTVRTVAVFILDVSVVAFVALFVQSFYFNAVLGAAAVCCLNDSVAAASVGLTTVFGAVSAGSFSVEGVVTYFDVGFYAVVSRNEVYDTVSARTVGFFAVF